MDIRQTIRWARARLKAMIVDETDGICECCNRKIGVDMHEVFVRRSALPVSRQLSIFTRGNCALVCRACHDGPANLEPFKRRFIKRLRRLGHEPFNL